MCVLYFFLNSPPPTFSEIHATEYPGLFFIGCFAKKKGGILWRKTGMHLLLKGS